MRSVRIAAACLWISAFPAYAGGLESRIREILERSPTLRNAHWGIQVADADSGEIVFQHNASKLFVPASNTKLFSTALALVRLGSNFQFTTTVLAERPPDSSGRVPGSLILVGGGDPNLSGRTIPYQKSTTAGDPLLAIRQLADQVVAAGVRRVDGDIIGDDTAYIWAPHPDGWAVDDPVWEYGAAVSALSLNDNAVKLTVAPGNKPGEPVRLTVAPEIGYYQIDNRAVTTAGEERKLRIDRDAGSLQLRLWGGLPAKARPRDMLLGVDDPARFAALALREELAARGVPVAGRAVARHRFPNEIADLEEADPHPPPQGVALARLVSAPLLEDLRILNKVSQNLHAELALRAVGKMRRGIGSREAGLAELKDFLTEIGIAEAEYEFFDGSGLSRLNLLAPAAVVKLLSFMYHERLRDAWISVLPVAGEDGTLSSRFIRSRGAGRIHAKTGSLSHVSALSGYARRPSGNTWIFAILVNHYRGPSSEVRAAMDQICNLLVE
jgi:D-alanyl-D-alanine carboxypeptidase/D-alanyl-D-alanine-endopeptidase (penicillin-binding protein 4)